MSDNIGLLLLCEVAAKPCYELNDASYNAAAECKNDGKMWVALIFIPLSTHVPQGNERYRTDPARRLAGRRRSAWPRRAQGMPHAEGRSSRRKSTRCIPAIQRGEHKTCNNFKLLISLQYIVYDTSQIKVKYLLMVKTIWRGVLGRFKSHNIWTSRAAPT